MDEVLLGFHLRQDFDQISRVWDSLNRAEWLLREDIAVPLSVDDTVWPACEDNNLISSLFSNYSHTPELDICNIFPEFLDQPSVHNGGFLIGITIVNDHPGRADDVIKKHNIDVEIYIEKLRAANWECLGYDVAAYSLISCLTNCGFRYPGKDILVQKFAAGLNDFGLFSSTENAECFRVDCESRIPEHAPFANYGIWAKVSPPLH